MQKILIPILAVTLCIAVVFSVSVLSGSDSPAGTIPPQTGSHAATDPQMSAPPETVYTADELLSFPLELEDGRLLLAPPFSYDGLNPDCGNEEARNIASITLKNCSGQHLLRAELTLVASDGTEFPFLIEHVPAARQIMAFALDNTPLPAKQEWVDVRISAQFAEQQSLRDNGVSISENGMTIAVTNTSDEALTKLRIYCHNLLGEEYFGGEAYPYEINNLPAGETVTVEALDCILGIAEAAYTEGN